MTILNILQVVSNNQFVEIYSETQDGSLLFGKNKDIVMNQNFDLGREVIRIQTTEDVLSIFIK